MEKHKSLSIKKSKQLINPKVVLELKKHNLNLSIGDKVIDNGGNVYEILKINTKGITLGEEWDNEEIHERGPYEFEKFQNEYLKLYKPLEELERDCFDELKKIENTYKDETKETTSTEIVPTMSKEYLQNMEKGLEEKRSKFEVLKRVLHQKRKLMSSIVDHFEKQVAKIRKVIGVLELYLGINEEVIQIREGTSATIDTPISFRQLVLYMDEEVGDPTDGGLDFKRIDEFDEWVCEPKNLQKVLPELKGVVILKPRRYEKDYGHWFVNAVYNSYNKYSYILVRNGDNLYRIWSEHIWVDERFFPVKDEFEKIKKETSFFTSYDEEKLQDKKFNYHKNALLMQGLIDRSEIFRPMNFGLNIFKPETYQNGEVVFIHDDEDLLPSNKKNWKKWKEEINESIHRGSRIYMAKERFGKDLGVYVAYNYRNAPAPGEGVYRVEQELEKDESRHITFIYHPKDIVYPDWYDYSRESHERKRGIGFTCNTKEWFILNYDRISLEDCEYYINNRIDRSDYLHLIPLLWNIKKERLKEIEWEKHFVELVANRLKISTQEVWKAVNWWKYKNIWKRPIREDDAKALRMIESKLKGLLNA